MSPAPGTQGSHIPFGMTRNLRNRNLGA
jgi:hypothetical protein